MVFIGSLTGTGWFPASTCLLFPLICHSLAKLPEPTSPQVRGEHLRQRRTANTLPEHSFKTRSSTIAQAVSHTGLLEIALCPSEMGTHTHRQVRECVCVCVQVNIVSVISQGFDYRPEEVLCSQAVRKGGPGPGPRPPALAPCLLSELTATPVSTEIHKSAAAAAISVPA